MTEYPIVLWHPFAIAAASLVVLEFTILAVLKCRPTLRVVAVVAAALFATAVVVGGVWEAKVLSDVNRFLDQKNFVWIPVESMLSEMQHSAHTQDWTVLTQQLTVPQENWQDIAMGKSNDLWTIHEKIQALGKREANQSRVPGRVRRRTHGARDAQRWQQA